MSRILKIVAAAEWDRALEAGRFEGSAIDLADGFIHFSAADQAMETARRYFRGQPDLVVLIVESECLGEALRWEVSRGGAPFPHLYRPLRREEVAEVRPAPLLADGMPDLSDLTP